MREGVPEGFEVSRPRPEEAAEVAALVATVELAQEGESETTTADIGHEWDNVDTDRDVWLVRRAGRLAAYGVLEREPRAVVIDGFVHPDSTARGLGRFLVRTMEARARELEPAGLAEAGASIRDAAGRGCSSRRGTVRPVGSVA